MQNIRMIGTSTLRGTRRAGADELDRDVARGTAQIARTWVRLDRERMRRDAELLGIALDRDLIDAGDLH